ncbi:MAG: HNH endonuclease [Bacteroidetes bacterium]|nr:HNH endonuclease [Bacteroidota bacterium]
MNWYLLRVNFNNELLVRNQIIEEALRQNLDDFFDDIIVPLQKAIEIEDAGKIIKDKPFYPGYVLVKMVVTPDTRFLVESIEGVIGFVGDHGEPMPLAKDELRKILEEPQIVLEEGLKATRNSLEKLLTKITKDSFPQDKESQQEPSGGSDSGFNMQPKSESKQILDDFLTEENLANQLQQINEVMKAVEPEKVESVVSETIRRDSSMIKSLKEFHQYKCQFPGCNVKIPKKSGGFYIEVAHIKPVKNGGQSVIGNLLVLCPNHHMMIDYGDFEVIEQTKDTLKAYLNGRYVEIKLPFFD